MILLTDEEVGQLEKLADHLAETSYIVMMYGVDGRTIDSYRKSVEEDLEKVREILTAHRAQYRRGCARPAQGT